MGGISNKVDDSGVTVGKRYARTDECGIPFAITVDYDTLDDDTVTLRELDSTKQVRLPIDELAQIVIDLMTEYIKWQDVVDKYGLFSSTEDGGDGVQAAKKEKVIDTSSKPEKKEPANEPVKKEKKKSSSKNKEEKSLEEALSENQWIMGSQPSIADREAYEYMRTNPPNPKKDPYTFAWFNLISQFSDSVRKSWGEPQVDGKDAGKKGKK